MRNTEGNDFHSFQQIKKNKGKNIGDIARDQSKELGAIKDNIAGDIRYI